MNDLNALNISWVYQNTLGVSCFYFKGVILIANKNLALTSEHLQQIKKKLVLYSVMVSQLKYYPPIDMDDLIWQQFCFLNHIKFLEPAFRLRSFNGILKGLKK